MGEQHKHFIGILVTFAIITAAIFTVHRFLLPMAWAAIITIVTWPLFEWWKKKIGNKKILASISLTLLITFIILFPLFWIIKDLAKEIHSLIITLSMANKTGLPEPDWLKNIPFISEDITDYWQTYLAKPHGLDDLLTLPSFHNSISALPVFAKNFSIQVLHRSVSLAFTILALFFFYKDGDILVQQTHVVGEYCLGNRWYLYAKHLPKAIKATVIGSVVVGLGVGLLMGISYRLLNLPSPALLGFITSILAMIPFGVPVMFVLLCGALILQGQLIACIILLIWGSIVMFVADHFVRPSIIGGATKLNFLAVLFGIMGGVENFGLIGLFIGPMIMVMFITLWKEPLLIVD